MIRFGLTITFIFFLGFAIGMAARPLYGADLKIPPNRAEKSAQKQYDDVAKTLASPIETPIGNRGKIKRK